MLCTVCLQGSVQPVQNVQAAHSEMVWRALVVFSISSPNENDLFDHGALCEQNLNYTCTHKGRLLVHGVF